LVQNFISKNQPVRMRHIEEAFYGFAGHLESAAMLEICRFKRINSVFRWFNQVGLAVFK
jgi:hypothetical protein